MDRRTLLRYAMGLAGAGPLAALAQSGKPPRIGYLSLQSKSDSRLDAFLSGLRDLGYVEGKTIAIACGSMPARPSRTRDSGTLPATSKRLGLMLKIASACPDCSICSVSGRLEARSTVALRKVREANTSG